MLKPKLRPLPITRGRLVCQHLTIEKTAKAIKASTAKASKSRKRQPQSCLNISHSTMRPPIAIKMYSAMSIDYYPVSLGSYVT